MLAMRKKLAILAAAICLCAVALGVGIFVGGPPRLDSKARKQWKEKTVSELAKQTSDTALVLKEVATVRSKPTVESEWDGWISDDLILMTNGDWMAYRNICAKEEGRIPDLFIGRGSDGRWYYSTYHFCIGMIVLKDMVGQPESLAKFRADCFLQEFDGRSDECLKKTWPLKH
jgi:hypothetical protein